MTTWRSLPHFERIACSSSPAPDSEVPGHFRISYCVSDATLEGSLPGFRAAFEASGVGRTRKSAAMTGVPPAIWKHVSPGTPHLQVCIVPVSHRLLHRERTPVHTPPGKTTAT